MEKSYNRFPYPAFYLKRIASAIVRSVGSKSTAIDRETLGAISEATDRFFGHLSNDLGVFAIHVGRSNINEEDAVNAVMSL